MCTNKKTQVEHVRELTPVKLPIAVRMGWYRYS